jgi:uncharacterized protein YgbK (DUF1537 family)
MRVGLIADDLTGACDAAQPFLRGGRVEVGIWPDLPRGRPTCAAISTESRGEPAQVAKDRSREAARQLRAAGCDLIYRKVDSQLRGNVAADLAGVLEDFEGRCIFAPALPGAGRRTVNGHQLWAGKDVDIANLLKEVGKPVTIRDASTDADLDLIAQEIANMESVLPAGTAGLAASLARALPLGHKGTGGGRGWPPCHRPLAVVGSPASRTQYAVARRKGWPTIWLKRTGRVPSLNNPDGLFLTGGDSAVRVLRALGATGLELAGQAAPLTPIGLIIGGRHEGMPVALKSGAFGQPDTISISMRQLRTGRR